MLFCELEYTIRNYYFYCIKAIFFQYFNMIFLIQYFKMILWLHYLEYDFVIQYLEYDFVKYCLFLEGQNSPKQSKKLPVALQ